MDITLQIINALIAFSQSGVEYETMQADSIYVFESVDSKITIKLDVYKNYINYSGLEQLCE